MAIARSEAKRAHAQDLHSLPRWQGARDPVVEEVTAGFAADVMEAEATTACALHNADPDHIVGGASDVARTGWLLVE